MPGPAHAPSPPTPVPSPVFAHGFARSPISALDAELSGWHPVDLAVVIAREALHRAQVSADAIDEVIVGCAEPVGSQGADVARAIVLSAGWPATIGGLVVERGETSGLTAVQVGTDAVRSGRSRRVLVVGLGMGSTVPPGAAGLNRTYGPPWGDGVAERLADEGGLLPAPRLAEAAARGMGLDRAVLDIWAQRSCDRRRATPPAEAMVAVAARPGDAASTVRRGDPVSADAERELGSIGDLPPAFDDDGITTAGTFAPPADGVAALVLESTPVVGLEMIGSGRAAGEPTDPTGGVGAAVLEACTSAGVDLTNVDPADDEHANHEHADTGPADDEHADGQHTDVGLAGVDLVEVAETSAATGLLVGRTLGLADGTINLRGGALATGDAGAAEEVRLVCDVVDRLADSETVLTVSAGPTGSAAILWRRRGEAGTPAVGP